MIELKAALLAIKGYLIAAGVAALVIAFFWYRGSLIDEGAQKVRDADAKAAATLTAKATALTTEWQAKADAAEHKHDDELTSLRAYRDKHPIGKLCLDTPGSAGYLPPARTADPVHARAAPSASVGQPVHPGNTDVATSRGEMLDAFAALLDTQDAKLREWQESHPVSPP